MSLAKPPLVAIVGPTAAGKTEVSLELAEEFHGEIVSADSRQVYRQMDIGTDKATPEQQSRVAHHLLDMANPTERYTVAQFQQAAITAIGHIQTKGRLPFLVGGTGLYVQAVVDNLAIPAVAPQSTLRAELDGLPLEELQQRLRAADPVGYGNIDQRNRRRLVRAIEVTETAGVPFSELKAAADSPFDTLIIGINKPWEVLEQRIEGKMTERREHGMIDEVKRLQESGISWEQLESFGLEYRRVAEHLQGKSSYEEMVERSARDLKAFAKRQLTWFKRDSRISWITDENEAEGLVSDWLVKRASVRLAR